MTVYPKFTDEEKVAFGLTGALPRHVGIIMDGNGRWAKARLLPRSAGHRAGMEALREIVRVSQMLGIEVLTVYAFSTENWKRPAAEKSALFNLLREYFKKELAELNANNVKIRILGEIERFSSELRLIIENAAETTEKNTGLKFCIALNYGSRAEIVRAVKAICESRNGQNVKDGITDEAVSEALYTSGLPDPDLIIRTAGEQRLSNFLLWQAAYSEFVFTKVFWPDFTPEIYYKCLREFQQRVRKFGGVKG